jgi:hypothetical protein
MKPFVDLYDYYLNDVPGCTYTLAVRAIRMAAQQFCERTRAWKVKITQPATVAGQFEYAFATGTDMRIVRTIGAEIDGRPVELLRADGTTHGVHGCAGIVVHDERRFTIKPAPVAGQIVTFNCAVAPSNSAVSLDEALYDRYAQAIAIGAKAELFGMKKQPFSDMDAALDERGRFEVEISRAVSNVGRNSNSAPVRVAGSFM